MGNWQLEVAKMAVYMAFPVTSFYVYHQVANFADIVNIINCWFWLLCFMLALLFLLFSFVLAMY